MRHKRWFATGMALLLTACGGSGGGSDDRGGNGNAGLTNQPPQITGLDDVTVSANETSQPLSFTVSDDGGADSVTLAASTDDPELLPDDAITLGGTDAERTLTVTPVAGGIGPVTVTVTATDSGGLATTASLQVQVTVQEVSFGGFFRDTFGDPASGTPRDLNSRSFSDDTTEGEFDDLVGDP